MKLMFLFVTIMFSHTSFADLKGIGSSYSTISIIEVDKIALKKILPNEIILNEQNLASKDKHPVIINYNIQNDVRFVFNDFNMQFFEHYNEVIIAVPYTRTKELNQKKNFTYLHKLYLDSLPPVLLGKAYGMNKTMSEISYLHDFFVVKKDGKDVLETNFYKTKKSWTYQLAKMKLKRILKDPILSFRKDTIFSQEQAVCANFNWNLENDKAWPIKQDLYFGEEYQEITNKEKIETTGLNLELINTSILMENNWDISPPLDCKTGKIDMPGPIF